ncbi:MAG: hypothetical protein M1823_001444 [Watsoniomyces obsoletus]|nr:MAG: hypothetical protein M1823_001444 [Watsoniomyces obsoletus]
MAPPAMDRDRIIEQTIDYVKNEMSEDDASRDYAHVERVVALADIIATNEPNQYQRCKPTYDKFIIKLAALLHDLGDDQYQTAEEKKKDPRPLGPDGTHEALDFLISIDVDWNIAQKVHEIVNAVSYRKEMEDPDHVKKMFKQHPELGPVHDADRLDSLGAFGIARCFTYGGAHGNDLEETMDHIEKKLLTLEKLMKTNTGKMRAMGLARKVKIFQEWWVDEVGALLACLISVLHLSF